MRTFRNISAALEFLELQGFYSGKVINISSGTFYDSGKDFIKIAVKKHAGSINIDTDKPYHIFCITQGSSNSKWHITCDGRDIESYTHEIGDFDQDE